MVAPSRTASSRAAFAGRPRLLAPSPETSITRRAPWKLLLGKSVMAWSMAPLIEVPPLKSWRGALSMASAKARIEASLSISIQGTTWICSTGPVHCVMVTTIARVAPEPMACKSRGLRKAAT
jgi:hypothetical protein